MMAPVHAPAMHTVPRCRWALGTGRSGRSGTVCILEPDGQHEAVHAAQGEAPPVDERRQKVARRAEQEGESADPLHQLGALIVLEEHAVSIPATDLQSLTMEMLQPLFDAADELDVVIFGMGERMECIPADIMKKLQALNIGSDPMDTGAACRCFNVLVTEDRRAAAVLLPV